MLSLEGPRPGWPSLPAASRRNHGAGKQAETPARRHEPAAHRRDGWAVVAAEVGGGLEARRQPPDPPYQLEVAPGLTLRPAARLDAVRVAVAVELEQRRGVVAGAAQAKLGSTRPSSSMNASTTRAGFLPVTWSSMHSGSKLDCRPPLAPDNKHLWIKVAQNAASHQVRR